MVIYEVCGAEDEFIGMYNLSTYSRIGNDDDINPELWIPELFKYFTACDVGIHWYLHHLDATFFI